MQSHTSHSLKPAGSMAASPDTLARLLLREAAAAQSRLAAALSHDLNSPIGALNSALDTMSLILQRHQEQPQPGGKLSEHLLLMKEVAQEACRRLIEIVGRMQRFTSSDKAPLQQTSVNDLIRDAIALLQPELDSRAEVYLQLDAVRPLKCKRKQLCIVFLELLRSVILQLPGGGTICINTAESNDEMTIRISSSGGSTDAARLPDSFEPAFAVQDGKVMTSNWTLFASRSVVLEHGGDIEIDSREGKGPAITIRLPLATPTETKETHPMTRQPFASKPNTKIPPKETATYFGLTVELLTRLPNRSLIRYRQREFLVETADLQTSRAVARAA